MTVQRAPESRLIEVPGFVSGTASSRPQRRALYRKMEPAVTAGLWAAKAAKTSFFSSAGTLK
jgi:hypothetical protein